MYKRKEIIGDCTLYLGDCQEVMKEIDNVDAVVTDPPYGIGQSGGQYRDRLKNGKRTNHRVLPKKKWDNSTPDKKVFDTILSFNCPTVIWGGNYFTDKLPVSKSWLYWQKLMGGDFSDGELAWSNLGMVLKEYTLCNKMHGKMHPTQKPVSLMKWCISHLPDNTTTILDPFMGSGTAGVACAEMGRKFIGIELDEEYFNIACKRIEDAYRQGDLFIGG